MNLISDHLTSPSWLHSLTLHWPLTFAYAQLMCTVITPTECPQSSPGLLWWASRSDSTTTTTRVTTNRCGLQHVLCPSGSRQMESHRMTKEELDEQFEQFLKEVNRLWLVNPSGEGYYNSPPALHSCAVASVNIIWHKLNKRKKIRQYGMVHNYRPSLGNVFIWFSTVAFHAIYSPLNHPWKGAFHHKVSTLVIRLILPCSLGGLGLYKLAPVKPSSAE